MKKQSFIKGTALLMTANAVSKILGAVFKIPLAYIIREEGMAVYNTAFNVYIMFLSFIISGFPFGISKLVSEYASRDRSDMINHTVRTASEILLVLGAAGSLILFFGARFFALAMKEEQAVAAIKLIAPSVFLVAAGVSYKSCFQGMSDMAPAAASQVLEAILKLVCGFLAAKELIKFGIEKAAAGAVGGVAAGELAATLLLAVTYFIRVPRTKTKICKGERREIINKLMSVAVPLLFTSAAASMLSVAETSMIRAKLIEFTADVQEARRIFGAYTGYALTVLHLPTGILATLGVSILPIIAGNIALGNVKRTRKAAQGAIRIIIICALPCAAAVYFLSGDILWILFRSNDFAFMLSYAAVSIVFMCVSQILAAIMQSAGKIMIPFMCMMAGVVIRFILGFVFIPKNGAAGAIFAANIGYFVTMTAQLWQLKKIMGLKYDLTKMLVKPLLSAAAMSAVMYFLYPVLRAEISDTWIFCAAVGGMGGITYILALTALGEMPTEIWFLFGGKQIRGIRLENRGN